MTIKRQFTWTCDNSKCEEVSKVFYNEYSEQPQKWATFYVTGENAHLHFCPSCAEAIKEVFKVRQ